MHWSPNGILDFGGRAWVASGCTDETMKGNPVDLSDPRRTAENLRDEALAALSVTRDNEVEITSARQLRILEDAARRILALHVDDRSVNEFAESTLARVATARRWTWVDLPAAAALTIAALAVGIGAALLGGTGGNIILAILGGIVSSLLLGVVVLRYRRENWRIRAERIAPMIWRHGV